MTIYIWLYKGWESHGEHQSCRTDHMALTPLRGLDEGQESCSTALADSSLRGCNDNSYRVRSSRGVIKGQGPRTATLAAVKVKES